MSLAIEALRRRLSACMNLDARRLSSRLNGIKKLPEGKQITVLETIAADLDAAQARYQSRLAGVPKVTYPDNLPVSQKQAEIAKAISEHQVVIIAGETGSGKTTQIPKICLALGRGVKGFIGHRANDFKCAGLWKVYGDEEKARSLFEKYRKCTEIYCALWQSGLKLEQLAVAV